MQKKGIQLSVNFLIIMILSIVILGFGVTLFTKLFQKSVDLQTGIDTATQKQIDQLLDNGEPISIPRTVRTIEPGEDYIFPMGVLNEFDVDVEFVLFIYQVTDVVVPFEVLYDDDLFTLQSQQKKYIPFKIKVPNNAPKKTYVFNVAVCHADDPTIADDLGYCSPPITPTITGWSASAYPDKYYLLKQIYVNVP